MIKPTKTTKKLQERLARIYIQKIRSSQWLVGSRIASIRSLSAEYGVATGTVAKAIRILEQDNYVSIRPGSGVYVNSPDLWNGTFNIELSEVDPLLEKPEEAKPVLHFLFHLSSIDNSNNRIRPSYLSHYTSILCYMQEEAEAMNWQLRIGSAEKIEEILEQATNENTRGVIYMPDFGHTADLEWPEMRFPKVLFSIGEKSLFSNYVTPDNYTGGCQAAKYMLQKTQKQLIICGNDWEKHYVGNRPYRERLQGFMDLCLGEKREKPGVREISNITELRKILDEVMLLPREERPGLVFLGDNFLSNDIEGILGAYFIETDYYKEVDVIVFQDYNQTDLNCASICFSVRQFCREVIDLIRRISLHPEDAPIRIKIPMKLKLPKDID